MAVLVEPACEAGSVRAQELARQLGLPLLAPGEVLQGDLLLVPTDLGLELRSGDAATMRGARVDLGARGVTATGRHRPGHADSAQPLRRALGRRSHFVVDATAGFGDDTVAIASWGHRVLAVERSPVIAALLEDGLARAVHDPALREIAARITLRRADAAEVLDELAAHEDPPDVVYIDPMFVPERPGSALPRKKIQLLRRLIGEDSDAESLVARALASGARRVVVKRALRARPLAERPNDSHRGKLVRYDVYLPPRHAG